MRDTFVRALSEIVRNDRSVLLLTADLGFGVLNSFADEFPKNYLNVGIAEQNMSGLATGMALEGKTIFTYSIGNFPTLRCLEQIRNDICYHNANVKIISIGGGFCYGPLGISHHATEDLAIMRSLPNMAVIAPGDLTETEAATWAVYKHHGPCYLRLGRGAEPKIHFQLHDFALGKAVPLYPEGEVCLIATGGILGNAVKARKILKDKQIKASLFSMPSLKPFDSEFIKGAAKSCPLIVSIEEHNIIGGLGSAVAETLAELPGPSSRLLRIGLNDCFSSKIGTQEYLREQYGLSPESISIRIEKELSKTSR